MTFCFVMHHVFNLTTTAADAAAAAAATFQQCSNHRLRTR